MIVDVIFESCIAFGIGAGLTLERNRATVRRDQSIPDEQRARLTEGDLRVVLADETRALLDQKKRAGGAVIDVLGHLGRQFAGKIGSKSDRL